MSRTTRRANQQLAHGKTILDAVADRAAKGQEDDEPLQQQEEAPSIAPAAGPSSSSSDTTTTKEKNVKKIIYCVRHGQSISNALWERPGQAWGGVNYNDYDSNVRDPSLTALGRAQAAQVLLQPPIINDDKVELIVVSPLTRCLETLHYSNVLDWIPNTTPTPTTTRRTNPPPVIVLPLATERVYSVSETGRSKSILRAALPPAATQNWDWSHVPDDNDENECWWYTGTTSDNNDVDDDDIDYEEWRPHGQGQIYAVPGEPMGFFRRRMEKLRHWLVEHRPEKCILLVTHWGVIRYLSGEEQQLELANGQVARLELTAASSSAASSAPKAGRSHG
jgi:broad specificity phosphatase PhoE